MGTAPRVAGLLLAAGSGSRMGTPKALVELDGRLLVERAHAALVAGGCDPVLVVLGAAADEVVARAVLPGAVVVVNPDHASGMGSSLAVGLAAATGLDVDAVVIALVDQPGAGAAVVRRLIASAGDLPDAAAVVAGYRGVGRNPVLLRRSCWAGVAASAEDDAGARVWLRAHPEQVVVVECGDLGNPDDLDTPESLRRARRRDSG